MDGIMGLLRSCNQKIGVQYPIRMLDNIVDSHRIQMMNQGRKLNFVSNDTQIASIITQYDMLTDVIPLFRPVKTLVYVPIEAESLPPDPTTKT